MKKILIPVILLALSAGGFVAWHRYVEPPEQFTGKVFVSGNIEATEVDLSFRIGGEIQRFPFEEGDTIKQVEVTASLDTDSLLAAKGAAEAEIEVAAANLEELEEGTRKEEIERARAALNAAESRLEHARLDYERFLELYKQKAIPHQTFIAKETAWEVARAEHERAAEQLQELEIGPRPERIRAARARLERAKWELKKINLDLEHSHIISPITGTLLTKANEVGEVVLPGASVGTVAETGKVWLKGYVGERYLGRVKLGQRAEITSDSYPDKKYTGEVTFISPRAEFTPKNVQTKEERVKQVYRVKITIPNPHHELKIGMPADGWIITDPDKAANQSSFNETK